MVPQQHLSTAFLKPGEVVSGSLGIAIMFAIASFIGFEATAVFRDEAHNPLARSRAPPTSRCC